MTMAQKDFEKYPGMKMMLLTQKALIILKIIDTKSAKKKKNVQHAAKNILKMYVLYHSVCHSDRIVYYSHS